MPDLRDGESVQMQGSAAKPYVLKNVAGVYSCSCPAWRNQSLPIDRRSCKHLRQLRSDAAEAARVGTLPIPLKPIKTAVSAPPLLLAEAWDGETDPTGWLMSEKLDGVRAYWDGQFVSRQGNRYHAPDWFTRDLPAIPLDGELWLGRKAFQRTVSIVRRQDRSDHWKEVRFLIFDAPAVNEPFEKRLELVNKLLKQYQPAYAQAHEHVVCRGLHHLQQELARIEALGGEGLMLREPSSNYVVGRSMTLRKVKRFRDAEARVIGHEPGAGRHKGRLGALLVEMANGIQFAVGTGLSDAERSCPPSVGSVITFRYQELSDGGVPRFPVYVGTRPDVETITNLSERGETIMPVTATKRRFEYVGGSSDKFWEVEVKGKDVTVRFGRNGTNGQTETKSFADAQAAAKHAARKIQEKLGKNYVEV